MIKKANKIKYPKIEKFSQCGPICCELMQRNRFQKNEESFNFVHIVNIN